MRKILWLSGLLALWLGAPFCANAQPSNLILLRNVNVAAATDNTRIEFRFNRTPNERGVTYQGDFVQVELPDTYVALPKQWINVGDGIIRNIFLYQWNDTTVRMRLFTPGKAEDLKDKIRFSQEGKRIFIQYNIPSENEASTMPGLTKGDNGGKEHENVIPAQAGIQNAGRGLDSHFRGNDGQLEGFASEAPMSRRPTKVDENKPSIPPLEKGDKGGFDPGFSGEVSAANPAANDLQAAASSESQEPPAPQPSEDIKLT